MSNYRVDFELLNAYVDGELDLARRTEIAEAIAREPFLAKQVVVLSRLKSEVAQSVHTPVLEFSLRQRELRPLCRLLVIVAGILVVRVIALGVV